MTCPALSLKGPSCQPALRQLPWICYNQPPTPSSSLHDNADFNRLSRKPPKLALYFFRVAEPLHCLHSPTLCLLRFYLDWSHEVLKVAVCCKAEVTWMGRGCRWLSGGICEIMLYGVRTRLSASGNSFQPASAGFSQASARPEKSAENWRKLEN